MFGVKRLLVKDSKESLYIYAQTMEGRTSMVLWVVLLLMIISTGRDQKT